MTRFLTTPNILTLSRILLLPVFAVGFFMESSTGMILSLSIFVFCCITDYLDGYYARAYKQTTELGKMLDPLADKVLISISILFIVGFGMVSKISIIPASIILCREIIISAVRDSKITSNHNFKTSKLAKWKTASQMISIVIIFISFIFNDTFFAMLGETMIWVSSIIALISGIDYCKKNVVLPQERE